VGCFYMYSIWFEMWFGENIGWMWSDTEGECNFTIIICVCKVYFHSLFSLFSLFCSVKDSRFKNFIRHIQDMQWNEKVQQNNTNITNITLEGKESTLSILLTVFTAGGAGFFARRKGLRFFFIQRKVADTLILRDAAGPVHRLSAAGRAAVACWLRVAAVASPSCFITEHNTTQHNVPPQAWQQ